MRMRAIAVTEYDARRLQKLIANPSALELLEPEALKSLKDELSRAKVVTPEDIPSNVVTMNSTVCLVDMETGEEETYTLVFPSDADISQKRLSVLAPIGTAILGYKVGDTLTWKVPGGERHLRVESVIYQPEASGDDHL